MQKTLTIIFLFFSLVACDSSKSSKTLPPVQEPAESPPVDQPTDAIPITDDAIGNPPSEVDSETPAADTADKEETASLPQGLQRTRDQFLKSIGQDMAVRALSFHKASAELQTTLLNVCAQGADKRLAQDAWKKVMGTWEHFELFQIGPIAENAKSLKYHIYAWPDAANLCKIDEEALKASKNPSYSLPPNNNRKGLQAIEYLLFEESLASRCPASSAVSKEWNGLNSEQKWQIRCAYLLPLVAELDKHAGTLAEKIGSSEDNFVSRILGREDQEKALLQTLFENLFYMDLEVKNQKLAAPSGFDPKYCSKSPEPCPEKEEFFFSQFSRQAIDLNIAAFTDLIYGPDRQGGFAALIRSLGQEEIASRSEAEVSKMNALSQEHANSLKQLITQKEDCNLSSDTWLCRLRSSIKSISSDLKKEYASILQLKVPEAPQGDND